MSDSFKDSEVDMALWKMYHRSQLLVYSSIYIYTRRAKRRKTYHLPRRSWYDVAGWMHPGRFKRFMRMSRGAFEKLHQKCCDAETDFGIERADAAGRSRISSRSRLGIALCFMGGASCQMISTLFVTGISTIYSIVWDTLWIIAKALPDNDTDFSDARVCEELAEGFSYRSPYFHLCVGCLDGIIIPTEMPPNKDINIKDYWADRKKTYGILAQCVCDSQYRFTYWSIKNPPSTHDSVSFTSSELYSTLISDDKCLPKVGQESYYFVGDAAYSIASFLLTPHAGKQNLTEEQDSYNFYHSSCRIHIEQAFGILKSRWRVFSRKLKYNLERMTAILDVALRLHNFVINEDSWSTGLEPSGASRRTNIRNALSSAQEPWLPTGAMAEVLEHEMDRADELLVLEEREYRTQNRETTRLGRQAARKRKEIGTATRIRIGRELIQNNMRRPPRQRR